MDQGQRHVALLGIRLGRCLLLRRLLFANARTIGTSSSDLPSPGSLGFRSPPPLVGARRLRPGTACPRGCATGVLCTAWGPSSSSLMRINGGIVASGARSLVQRPPLTTSHVVTPIASLSSFYFKFLRLPRRAPLWHSPVADVVPDDIERGVEDDLLVPEADHTRGAPDWG